MLSGIWPSIILIPIPSAIAVFPTPGSPIKIGLFLVLLEITCIVLLISSSRPIIGSILLFNASLVISDVYLSMNSNSS